VYKKSTAVGLGATMERQHDTDATEIDRLIAELKALAARLEGRVEHQQPHTPPLADSRLANDGGTNVAKATWYSDHMNDGAPAYDAAFRQVMGTHQVHKASGPMFRYASGRFG
jgi:hypothetical protein